MSIRILVAVDGSDNALRAVEHAIRLSRDGQAELHLLTVQAAVDSGQVRRFISHEQLEDYYRDEGLAALQAAVTLLQQGGHAYTPHIAVGHVAETIAAYASEMKFDQIVIGTHGRSGLSELLLGSVASDVVKLAPVPVTVVK